MAEYCPECWDRLNGTFDSKHRYVLSREKELCECCGRYRRIIITARPEYPGIFGLLVDVFFWLYDLFDRRNL